MKVSIRQKSALGSIRVWLVKLASIGSVVHVDNFFFTFHIILILAKIETYQSSQ